MKFGEYLVQLKALSKDQLKEALALQVDNNNLKLGQILVSMNLLDKESFHHYLDKYVHDTGYEISEIPKWLNQDEVDELLDSLK